MAKGGGNLRVTRQYAELLAKGGGNLRVTRQYAEVLAPISAIYEENVNESLTFNDVVGGVSYDELVNDTLTFDEWVSGPFFVSVSDSLSFTETLIRVHTAEASDSLAFGENVLTFLIVGDFIPIAESLTITDAVYVETGNWRYTSTTLSISDSADWRGPRYASASSAFSIYDHVPTPFYLDLENELDFDDFAGRGICIVTTSELNFYDELSRLCYYTTTTFQIDQYVNAAKSGGAIVTTIEVDGAIQLLADYVRSLTTDTGLGHSLTYFIASPCSDKEYGLFIGESTLSTSPGLPGEALPLAQGLPVGTRFMLAYPGRGGATDTVTLRAPNFGNLDRFSMDRINRETRGGNIIIYADPNWPKVQVVSVSLSGLTKTEVNDLQRFLSEHLGEEVHVTDWEGREWLAVITTPNDPATNDGQDNWSMGFEFEGTLFDGYQPGEAATIQDTVLFMLHRQREASESLEIIHSVTYLHIPA